MKLTAAVYIRIFNRILHSRLESRPTILWRQHHFD